jgi:DNA-3-methyladenine glycosylase I
MQRCEWCTKDDLYIQYHDNEWGDSKADDRTLFESLCLESFQAGLSWYTILKKREGFRKAFDGFNANKIAKYNEDKIEELLQDVEIVRHRGKIEATIGNAQAYLRIKETQSFDAFVKNIVGEKQTNSIDSMADGLGKTPKSDMLSKAFKKAGFKFVGSTTCYSFMQACGYVNDHMNHCYKK